MATTAIWKVKGWLGQVVHYVENPNKTENPTYSDVDMQGLRDVMDYATQDYKTEQQFYVSGINCIPETARQEMLLTKKQFGKESGIVAFHGYQSFAPGEVTPDQAHKIGMELAQELWGDRFQVIVATHLDKAHLHSHFVLNSVSFIDGKRYNDCKATYALMRRTSDRLCRGYSLSVIEHPERGKQRSYDAWQAERNGQPTWWSIVRADVDAAIKQSMTTSQFMNQLKSMGYEIKTGKYLAIRPQGKERFVSLITLGENYAEEAIRERLLRQRQPERLYQKPQPAIARARFAGSFKLHIVTFKSLRTLYYYYLKKLRQAQHSEYFSPALIRDELRKLDEFSAQTKLLVTNKIDTREELISFLDKLEAQIHDASKQRDVLSSKLRRTKDPQSREEIVAARRSLNKALSGFRSDRKRAQKILSRSEGIRPLASIERKQALQPKHMTRQGICNEERTTF